MSKRARASLEVEASQDAISENEAPKLMKTGGMKKIPESSLQCSLPPTCHLPNNSPTQLASMRDLEQHFATYHTHICTASLPAANNEREKLCGKVFPDTRFLDLHLIECHDPMTAIKQERGEKTFACFLTTCNSIFINPKGRRRHLIDAHGYPKEFFFSLPNKGVGDLLTRFGPGASLLRREWHDRSTPVGEPRRSDSMETDPPGLVTADQPKTEVDKTLPIAAPHGTSTQATSIKTPPTPPRDKKVQILNNLATTSSSSDLEALTSSISALSLVPTSIRFGRGGRKGGFIGRGHKPGVVTLQQGDVNVSPEKVLGGGKRGGGKGRGVGLSGAVYDLAPGKKAADQGEVSTADSGLDDAS